MKPTKEATARVVADKLKGKRENGWILEGMACPQCGQSDRFRILYTGWIEATDLEVQNLSDEYEWDDDSKCECYICEHITLAKDFYVEDWEVN